MADGRIDIQKIFQWVSIPENMPQMTGKSGAYVILDFTPEGIPKKDRETLLEILPQVSPKSTLMVMAG